MDRKIYDIRFLTYASFHFSILYLLYHFNFSSTHKTVLLFVTEDMLLRYQSPVKSSSRNEEGNTTHQVYYRYCCHFPGLETIQLPERLEGLSSQLRGGGRNLQTIYLSENYNGTDDWQCLYIRGTYSYVCRTKQGKKTRALWGTIWYHRMHNAIAEVSHKPSSL